MWDTDGWLCDNYVHFTIDLSKLQRPHWDLTGMMVKGLENLGPRAFWVLEAEVVTHMTLEDVQEPFQKPLLSAKGYEGSIEFSLW